MSSTIFLNFGNSIYLESDNSLHVTDTIPTGTYTLKYDNRKDCCYLELGASFSVPSKVYGDAKVRAKRVLNTYIDRNKNTGVLLSGIKGSGKTILAKLISAAAAQELSIPTIIVDSAYENKEAVRDFFRNVRQRVIFIFDEFEKTFDHHDQQEMLTILDGLTDANSLFLFTVNDRWGIGDYMHNRPGRIYYNFEYSGLDASFIQEYCEDTLKCREYSKNILDIASVFKDFTFDALQALVEEVNRYGEEPSEAIQYLNLKLDKIEFNITIQFGTKHRNWKQDDRKIYVHPITRSRIVFDVIDGDDDYTKMILTQDMLTRSDPVLNEYVYTNHEGDIITFTKVVEDIYDFKKAF